MLAIKYVMPSPLFSFRNINVHYFCPATIDLTPLILNPVLLIV